MKKLFIEDRSMILIGCFLIKHKHELRWFWLKAVSNPIHIRLTLCIFPTIEKKCTMWYWVGRYFYDEKINDKCLWSIMTNKTWALQVCEEQNKTLHIHSNSDGILAPPTCTECCHTDLCNAQGCGQPGMTKGALSPDRLEVLLLFEYYSLVDNYFYYICSLLFFSFALFY